MTALDHPARHADGPERPPERVPFPVVDEVARHCLQEEEPETVHIEVHLPGTPDPDRLKAAFAEALRRHPRILMREARGPWYRRRYEWELTAEPDVEVVTFPPPERDALKKARTRSLSEAPPLSVSPPIRLEVIASDGEGDTAGPVRGDGTGGSPAPAAADASAAARPAAGPDEGTGSSGTAARGGEPGAGEATARGGEPGAGEATARDGEPAAHGTTARDGKSGADGATARGGEPDAGEATARDGEPAADGTTARDGEPDAGKATARGSEPAANGATARSGEPGAGEATARGSEPAANGATARDGEPAADGTTAPDGEPGGDKATARGGEPAADGATTRDGEPAAGGATAPGTPPTPSTLGTPTAPGTPPTLDTPPTLGTSPTPDTDVTGTGVAPGSSRRPASGSVLFLTINHTALDGPACLRVLATAAELYGGQDNSPAAPPSRTASSVGPESAAGVGDAPSGWAPPARVSRGTPEPSPGNGMLVAELPVPRRPKGAPFTVNDQLMVATALMIAHWNREHGRRPKPFRITMPVDDRPRSMDMPIGNGTRLVEVPFSAAELTSKEWGPEDIGALLRRTADRTRALKALPRPQLGRGAALLTSPVLPVTLRAAVTRGLRRAAAPWTSTTLLSNIGRVPYPLDFGDAGRAHAVWFSAPARLPRGLTVTTASTAGRLHVALRWSKSLLSSGDGAHLRDLFEHYLHATEHTEEGKTP